MVAPCGFTYRWVLTPLGRGLSAALRGAGVGLAWLWRWLVVAPCGLAYRWVLAPFGRGVAVVAREVAEALGHAWRVAGYVSRAVFRFLGAVLRLLVADPAVWVWRNVARPFGRGVRAFGRGARDALWRPAAQAVREAGRSARAAFDAARASVRETRAELRRAIFGAPSVTKRKPLPGDGRVPLVAGSPHNSATAPNSFGSKRDDADFRTL